MAYRIRYGAEEKRGIVESVWMAQVLMAAVLLVCLLLMNVLPGGAQRLEQVFLPGSGSAAEAMGRTLCESGSVRQAFVVYCREVLEDAGYAA